MLAGREPSVLVLGTVSWMATSRPLRSATRSAGAEGTLTSGGSGGPFRPQAVTAATRSDDRKNLHHGAHRGHRAVCRSLNSIRSVSSASSVVQPTRNPSQDVPRQVLVLDDVGEHPRHVG